MTIGPAQQGSSNDIFVGGIQVEGGVLAGPDAVIPTVVLQVTGFAGLEERHPAHLRLHFQAADVSSLIEGLQAAAAESIETARRTRDAH